MAILQVSLEELEMYLKLWMDVFELDDLLYLKIIKTYRPGMRVSPKFVFKYFIRFLELWGMRQAAPWIDPYELADAINGNADQIASFNQSLVKTDVIKRADELLSVFRQLMKVKHLGPTGVSKVLHLLNPKFFIMWDREIARAYGVNPNPEGYLEFTLMMRELGRKVLSMCSERYGWRNPEAELARKYRGKPLTKLLDEYNWLKTRRWINRLLALEVNRQAQV